MTTPLGRANVEGGMSAQEVAARLWPDLELVETGSPDDLSGIDARTAAGRGVQIKLDRMIAETGNLFWEIAKRNDGEWNYWGKAIGWHGATAAHEYVWITRFRAFRVGMEELIRVSQLRRPIVRSRGTAFGFIIPLRAIVVDERPHGCGFYH